MGKAPAKLPKKPIDPAAAAAAKEAARKKLEEQIASDQKWLDTQTANMTPQQKQEVFNELSKECPSTKMEDGKIVLGCPIKPKMIYCMPGDPFDCPNGKVPNAKGCALSSSVTDALAKKGTKIDGVFVSAEEGGSYLSPYVPWGPISGKNKKAVLTKGNSSGATIGTGVDLGAIGDADAYIARLKKKGVSQGTLDKIKPLLGKKREEACQALRDLRGDQPLVFDQKDVELIDEDAMETRAAGLKSAFNKKAKLAAADYDRKIAAAAKKVPPDTASIGELTKARDALRTFDDLDGREQSVLFSTFYHEGNINGKTSQSFVGALLGGDGDGAAAALAAKAKSTESLLASRGKAEVAYWAAHAPGK